jgi:hypothetical protein
MDARGIEDVLVLFKAGDYFINDTVRLGEPDSGAGTPAAEIGVDLSDKGWPGTESVTYRGALPPEDSRSQ